ncbi:MAG: hypothetical protein AAB901_01830, partial [Patescibacteria group bacterium]
VETLVAITLLVIALMGPFQVVQQAVATSYAARDQLIATALAEEAVEYVRSIRDGNYLYNLANPGSVRSWMYGLDGTSGPNCFAANGCTVDPAQSSAQTALAACGGTCAPLKLSTSNIYTQSSPVGAVTTRFTRKITLTQISANEVKVTATVTWISIHVPFTMTVTDNLQNWL